MKKIICAILFLIMAKTYSQEYNLIIYKTYNDYKTQNGKLKGKLTALGSQGEFNYLLYKNSKNKEKNFILNSAWGFKVDNSIYRIKKIAGIYKNKYYLVHEKDDVIFYSNGAFSLSQKLGFDDETKGYSLSQYEPNHMFSKDLESSIKPLKYLKKYYPNDNQLKDLIKCINSSLDRFNYRERFKDINNCINEN